MANKRPVPSGRKPANARGRQSAPDSPARPQTGPAAPGPRRPSSTSGGPSDPRPIAAPLIKRAIPSSPPEPVPPDASEGHEPTCQAHAPGAATTAHSATTAAAHSTATADSNTAAAAAHSTATANSATTADSAAAPSSNHFAAIARGATAARLANRPLPGAQRRPRTDNAAQIPTHRYGQALPSSRAPASETAAETAAAPGRASAPAAETPEAPLGAETAEEKAPAAKTAQRTTPAAPETAWRTATTAPETVAAAAASRLAAIDRVGANSRSTRSPAGLAAESHARPPAPIGVAKIPAPRSFLPGLRLQPMVHVGDMATAVAFYEKLGGEINHGDRHGEWVLMQVGTAQIGLVTRPPDAARGASTVELNFCATMPLDRLERWLRDRDVKIVEVVRDLDLGTQLHVETPDGMPIRIHQVESDLMV